MAPEGWKDMRLGDVANIDADSLGTMTPDNYEFDYISLSNVEPGRIVFPLERLTFASAPSRARRKIKPGDLLLSTVRPNLLGFAEVQEDHKECIASTGFAVVSPTDQADGSYIFHYLFCHHMKSQFNALVVGSNYPAINSSDVKKLRLKLPPLPEQQKIADILSTWDDAIEKTEALLATARTQKRALMQQLLTGKRRFPEFEGQKWKNVPLGELGRFHRGKGLSKNEAGSEGKFPCVLYGELYTIYGEIIIEPVSYTDRDDGFPSKISDVLIPASTTTVGIDLAIASCILADDVRLGGDINIFRRVNDKIDGVFLAYFLTHARRHEMARFAQGVPIVHLKGSDLLGISVSVPPIEEQQKIVEIAAYLENEIEGHMFQIEKLRNEKKALMQQLLTGKRRVPVA